jgi:hypothetical protein
VITLPQESARTLPDNWRLTRLIDCFGRTRCASVRLLEDFARHFAAAKPRQTHVLDQLAKRAILARRVPCVSFLLALWASRDSNSDG